MSTKTMFEPIQVQKEEKKPVSLADIQKYRILPSDEIPKPDVVLFIGGKIIATRKNIFGIKGKAKVGKSFLMSLLNAAVLKKGDFGVISSYLPKGKDKILYIDTEQSNYHVSLAIRRIKDMVETKNIDNLLMYAFDAVPTTERYAYTEFLIQNTKDIGLVIIDGIADLVKTVNDEIIACDMADTLRRWATIQDVAIGYVLHENPSDSGKMRGHLGTVLANKSETVIQIESSKDNESIKLVSTAQTRNAKPEDWSFEIIDGVPVIMDELHQDATEKRRVVRLLNDTERYSLLIKVFAGNDVTGIPYNVMVESIREAYTELYGNAGDTKIKQLVTYCREKVWLVQPDGAKTNYHLYPFEK